MQRDRLDTRQKRNRKRQLGKIIVEKQKKTAQKQNCRRKESYILETELQKNRKRQLRDRIVEKRKKQLRNRMVEEQIATAQKQNCTREYKATAQKKNSIARMQRDS